MRDGSSEGAPLSEATPDVSRTAVARSPTARVLLLVLVVVAAAVGFAFLPLGRWALDLVEWIRGAGAAGMVAFAAAYVLATALLLPGSLLTLGAGFAYGPVVGTLLVSPVSVLAATVAFSLGRFVARESVARRIGRDRRFTAIDSAVGDHGLRIVTLLRLSPILPFNLLNYALGLTKVHWRDYVTGSFVGMLPGTVLYVYLGSLITSASELAAGKRPDAGPWGNLLYWGGLAGTVLVTVLLTRLARGALRSALDGDAPPARRLPENRP